MRPSGHKRLHELSLRRRLLGGQAAAVVEDVAGGFGRGLDKRLGPRVAGEGRGDCVEDPQLGGFAGEEDGGAEAVDEDAEDDLRGWGCAVEVAGARCEAKVAPQRWTW